MPIHTDRTVYALRPARKATGEEGLHREFVIVATYINRTGGIVYPEYCTTDPPRYHLEKKVNGEWVPAFRPACAAIGDPEPPFAIEPGAQYTDTITVAEYSRLAGPPRFEVDTIPGVYRMVYRLYKSWGRRSGGEPLPEEARISNEFRIEVQSQYGSGTPGRSPFLRQNSVPAPFGASEQFPDAESNSRARGGPSDAVNPSHDLNNCRGTWKHQLIGGNLYWRCKGCGAIAYHCDAVADAAIREYEMGTLLQALTTMGQHIRDNEGQTR